MCGLSVGQSRENARHQYDHIQLSFTHTHTQHALSMSQDEGGWAGFAPDRMRAAWRRSVRWRPRRTPPRTAARAAVRPGGCSGRRCGPAARSESASCKGAGARRGRQRPARLCGRPWRQRLGLPQRWKPRGRPGRPHRPRKRGRRCCRAWRLQGGRRGGLERGLGHAWDFQKAGGWLVEFRNNPPSTHLPRGFPPDASADTAAAAPPAALAA